MIRASGYFSRIGFSASMIDSRLLRISEEREETDNRVVIPFTEDHIEILSDQREVVIDHRGEVDRVTRAGEWDQFLQLGLWGSGSGSISRPASEAASAIATAAPPEIDPTATLRPCGSTPLLAAWVIYQLVDG